VKRDRSWLLQHRKRVAFLRLQSSDLAREQRRNDNARLVKTQSEFKSRRIGLTQPIYENGYLRGPFKRLKATKMLAPEVFCIDREYKNFLGYIYAIRWEFFKRRLGLARNRRVLIAELRETRYMSIDAALVLVSEYHRFLLFYDKRKIHIDDLDWPNDIVEAFEDLGFYDLIQTESRSQLPRATDPTRKSRWVRFRSEKLTDGPMADELIADLESIAGATPDRMLIYEALVEAINNCKGHAYKEQPRQLEPKIERWWSAGAFDDLTGVLHIVVYDQGEGIPKTLMRRSFVSSILARCPPEFTDADVIAGAVEFGRSSVAAGERGNGLAKMFELVKSLPGSYMKITSGRGAVLFKASGKIKRQNLSNPFTGTLVCWSLNLPESAAGAN
jgi:hypothetical protein